VLHVACYNLRFVLLTDAVIQARLANDEKLLRRLVRKFYAFSSLARASSSEAPGLSDSSPLDEARNAFLMDLSAYQLWLKKSDLSCKAESRQVLEYQQEKERLGRREIHSRLLNIH
jgi:THO complex subunit 7